MALKVLIVEDQFLEARSLGIILRNAGHHVEGNVKSVAQALEFIDFRQPDIVLVDIFLQGSGNGIDLAKVLDSRNIPFIYLSANSHSSILEPAIATRPYGFLVKPFREREILIALDIAMYRYQKNQEFTGRQQAWLGALLHNILQTSGARLEKSLALMRALTSFLPFEYVRIDAGSDCNDVSNLFYFQRVGFDEYIQRTGDDIPGAAPGGNDRPYFSNRKSSPAKEASGMAGKRSSDSGQLLSFLRIPLAPPAKEEMSITFYSKEAQPYTSEHLQLLISVKHLLHAVLEELRNSLPDASIAIDTPAGKSPNQLLKPKIEGIIGKSTGLLEALDKVTQVAPFDNTVLILGETGVGKEGLVKAIHQLSTRKTKPLVKINCAAIPVNLVESELFGHEKGAFTGALDRRIGKFEQANGGTLFLDEIGELPLEVQSKLLRAIQEKEIERIGGRATIRTDVRIIAATNRDLRQEIGEGRFRLDLYYRINVFPIVLPPLRQRKEDIADLAGYFLKMYGMQMNRADIAIAPQAMRQLQEYRWPGNIRELQHLIERHVLGCRNGLIEHFEMPEPIPARHLMPNMPDNAEQEIRTYADMDRHHILLALKKCNGKISGRGGAAELLQLPPTTLSSKMKRLGIKWPPE